MELKGLIFLSLKTPVSSFWKWALSRVISISRWMFSKVSYRKRLSGITCPEWDQVKGKRLNISCSWEVLDFSSGSQDYFCFQQFKMYRSPERNLSRKKSVQKVSLRGGSLLLIICHKAQVNDVSPCLVEHLPFSRLQCPSLTRTVASF